jgi:hypothetical protein
MSAPVATVEIVNTEVAQKAQRVKKPSLPAKYNKFMSFGFWFLNKLDATVRDQLFAELKLYGSIEEQSALFQSYLDEASASNKIMRKTVAAFHKPPKVRATKSSRKTSKPVATESDDLIAKLISDANGTTMSIKTAETPSETPSEKPKKTKKSTKKTEQPVPETPVAETPVAEKPKKTRKSTKKTAETPVVETPVAETPVVETPAEKPVVETPAEKPKKTKKSTKTAEQHVDDTPVAEKPKKTKKSTKKTEQPVVETPSEPLPVTSDQQPDDEDSDEIQTRIVTIEDKQYLADADYNLYDINSHEEIGRYDATTKQIIKL